MHRTSHNSAPRRAPLLYASRHKAANVARAMFAAAWCIGASASTAAQVVAPGDFRLAQIATGLDQPTAIDFAPDGRLFIAEKRGRIRIVEDGELLDTPFAEVEVYDFLESGLLGLAVDPDYETNHFVYVFATVSDGEQNIIRFTDENGVGSGRTVVRANLPSAGALHNGGGLEFGPDGKLYFSIGDNADPDNGQDLATMAGKICRINPDGSTPNDNPFTTPTGSPRAAFAYGFRNPFRFCFAPDGRMFAVDLGSDDAVRREEINYVQSGLNYGWPTVEGLTDAELHPDLTPPIFDYYDKGSAPCGIVYYTGEDFPSEYSGNLFQIEYTLNRIYRIVLDGNSVVSHEIFAETDGAPVDLAQAPDGSLYYCEVVAGNVMRISFGDDAPNTGGNNSNSNGTDTDPAIQPFDLCGLGALMPSLALAISILALRRR
jgi:glucose/arabinose dehydrogenase